MVDEPGQHTDVGQLGHLTGLEAGGQAGEKDPAAVSGAVVSAEGEQQQDNGQAQHQKYLPPLFQQKFQVYKGNDNVDHNAQAEKDGLFQGVAVEGRVVPGGAVHQGDAKEVGAHAQGQEQHVPFFKEITKVIHEDHGSSPLIIWERSQ